MAYNVCKYADKRSPDMCRYYLLRSTALKKIMREYESQNEKWGEQNHPMLQFAPLKGVQRELELVRRINEDFDSPDWFYILLEEVYEAFAETDPAKQREEMVQVAAVAVQIIECLDRQMDAAE
jgi:hypothetical protein